MYPAIEITLHLDDVFAADGGVQPPLSPRLGTCTWGTNLLPSTELIRTLEPPNTKHAHSSRTTRPRWSCVVGGRLTHTAHCPTLTGRTRFAAERS